MRDCIIAILGNAKSRRKNSAFRRNVIESQDGEINVCPSHSGRRRKNVDAVAGVQGPVHSAVKTFHDVSLEQGSRVLARSKK